MGFYMFPCVHTHCDFFSLAIPRNYNKDFKQIQFPESNLMKETLPHTETYTDI